MDNRIVPKHLFEISVSSFKQGQEAFNLLDDNAATFWQSDGPQPHRVSLLFKKALNLSRCSIYLDFSQDESYTPSKISLRIGPTALDIIEGFDDISHQFAPRL